MKKIVSVVTGATGHIGSALVRDLIKKGHTVKALVLPNDNLKALKGCKVEVIKGNVTNISSLINAFEGADYVFHLAGIISIGTGKKKLLEKVNVGGTQNVLEACEVCKIKRLIYTSSVHAIAEPSDNGIINENTDFNPVNVKGLYAKSKAKATRLVLNAAKNGLDAVVVFPSGVIGPYEYKTSNLGQLVIDFMKKRLKAYIDGAYNFVDVRDVSSGICLAAENGKAGEGYILSGEKVTVKQLLDNLHTITGVKPPKCKLPYFLAKMTAPFAELYYKILKQPPLYTSYAVSTLRSNCNISNLKAKNELGYKTRPIKQSLNDCVKWLKNNPKIKK